MLDGLLDAAKPSKKLPTSSASASAPSKNGSLGIVPTAWTHLPIVGEAATEDLCARC